MKIEAPYGSLRSQVLDTGSRPQVHNRSSLSSVVQRKMSIRSLTRQPKRMLVFFEADKTTCVLPTNRIKNILDQNKELTEGSRVEILYEKELFEAQVLKLHGKFQN